MQFSVLGSGSRGNSVYIESGETSILIDAGFSGKELQKRLDTIGRSLSQVKALCITHEHNDHICGAGIISRRHKIPVYINAGTLEAGCKKMGTLHETRTFVTGDSLEVGELKVRSFRISHDTADPVGFVISNGLKSLGYCTDTGKTSHLVAQRLATCDAVILEFNHDLQMLKLGPYPLPLQQRVRSSRGHLSNDDAGDFLSQLMGGTIREVVLAHLSEKNNTVELAKRVAELSIRQYPAVNLHIARQDTPMPLLDL